MKHRIVVIDDSQTNLFLIKSVFEDDEDIEILTEDRSTDATKLIEKAAPDLIIMDLMMPKVDGLQLLKELKNNESFRHIPVIIVSANIKTEIIKTMKEEGAFDYLTKPVDIELIRETVFKAL